MLTVAGIVTPIFALILLGWIAGRRRLLPGEAVASLNGFTIWFALPALLFQAVAEARASDLQPGFIAAFTGGMAITFTAALLLARGRPLADRAMAGLAAGYANTAFIGIPLGVAVFGPLGLSAAIAASLLTVSLLFAIGVLLVEVDLHCDHGIGSAALKVAAALVRNPLVAAPIAGGLWRATGLAVPAPLHAMTALLGAAASPAALVTLGLFLAEPRRPAPRAPIVRAVVLKLLLQPLATAAIAFWLLPVPRAWASAAVLIAALPTGTGPFMVAQLYGRERAATAAAILATTLLSLATISALLIVLHAH